MQPTLFEVDKKSNIVNIATVTHRSVFRYPGGKTWLVPYFRQWLTMRTEQHVNAARPRRLIEPFVGGGIISLTAVAENLVDQVVMAEKDEDVAAVWQTVLHPEDWQWLADEILSFDMNYDNVINHLARTNVTKKEQAFKTVLRNRVNRGGILAPGAGLLKSGENGKGLKSRWYAKTLFNRIEYIHTIRDHITFTHGDGIEILERNASQADSVFFIDPPYTAAGKKAGKRLYRYFEVDHEKLFNIASHLQGDFLMTYDDTNEIREMARSFHFDVERVPMTNTHHATLFELLIGPNLEWVRSMLY